MSHKVSEQRKRQKLLDNTQNPFGSVVVFLSRMTTTFKEVEKAKKQIAIPYKVNRSFKLH
jgi:hypothetical protein